MRNKLHPIIQTMSSCTFSENLVPVPVPATSTSSSSVCLFISFSLTCLVGSVKSKENAHICRARTKRFWRSLAGTSRKEGSGSA